MIHRQVAFIPCALTKKHLTGIGARRGNLSRATVVDVCLEWVSINRASPAAIRHAEAPVRRVEPIACAAGQSPQTNTIHITATVRRGGECQGCYGEENCGSGECSPVFLK